MEIVPQFWLLKRGPQSRIFQQISVPDILKKVLDGPRRRYEIQGTFQPRDYCVQYRETDFDFASRLMEEEGIYYFFRHTADGHTMVVANTPQSHPDAPGPDALIFESSRRAARRGPGHAWEKAQELRSGKFTLWDHCFELPHKHLEADQTIQSACRSGQVSHKLQLGRQRRAGALRLPRRVRPAVRRRRPRRRRPAGGARRRSSRTTSGPSSIRMQEEAAPRPVDPRRGQLPAVRRGAQVHPRAPLQRRRRLRPDGGRALGPTGRRLPRSAASGEFDYQNTFACIPLGAAVPPAAVHARSPSCGDADGRRGRPAGRGDLHRQVRPGEGPVPLGPRGQERRRQLVLDPRGARSGPASGWGVIHIPRIGQEVIVDFLEGDPDQPIIIGSVYNADQMPPGDLPATAMVSGLKSALDARAAAGFNGMRAQRHQGQGEDRRPGRVRHEYHGRARSTSRPEQPLRQHGHDDSESIGETRA